MKKILFILLTLPFLLFSCMKSELSEGKSVDILFSPPSLFGGEDRHIDDLTHLKLFALNDDDVIVRVFDFSPEKLNSGYCSINLPIGSYKLIFIANGESNGEIEGEIDNTIEKITMKLLKEENNYREASDFLTATQTIHLTENSSPDPLEISLARRVGKIRVELDNLNPQIDDIKIEITQAPNSLTFDGTTKGSISIIKDMDHEKGEQSASCELLTFPIAANIAEVAVLYTINQITYRGFIKLAPAVEPNQIVMVSGKYRQSFNQDFEVTVCDWSGEEISGGQFTISESDEIVGDATSVTGDPIGPNLVVNGDFEEWDDNQPIGWAFLKEGNHNVVTCNSDSAYIISGSKSLRMEQSTYMYQNVAVEEFEGYQINLNINCNTTAFKWKINCTWRKSSAVSSSSLLSTPLNNLIQTENLAITEGWKQPLGENIKLRAPAGAKFLRVEIRTYSIGSNTLPPNEGVYVDKFEVFKCESN